MRIGTSEGSPRANSFGARSTFSCGGRTYGIFRTSALASVGNVARLPYAIRILLENVLRHEDGVHVTEEHVRTLASWAPTSPREEIPFSPARVLLQDFTGVPALVDLAGMRDAMAELGGSPEQIEPLIPAELVIDHSIVADVAGVPRAFERNASLELARNEERYRFLRWGQQAFQGFRVVPPNTGICHQVNLESLARVVFEDERSLVYPDSLVGTDSHTPMINGLGVLGWGVGGIEAEAALLGLPISMLVPDVVGLRLSGELRPGVTATDLVLHVTELLREIGVVGKIVELYGPGVGAIAVETRATIGNMSPEYGSTCTIFPIDDETLRYLRFTGRDEAQVRLVEAYAKEQGLWHDPSIETSFSQVVELELGRVEPSIAGPKLPQDRVPLADAKRRFREALAVARSGGHEVREASRRPGVPPETTPPEVRPGTVDESSLASFPASDPPALDGLRADEVAHPVDVTERAHPRRASVRAADGSAFELADGHVVIAAITSCTNTSNPSVMIAAGLLARRAHERGLAPKPWVKTSLAPGSKVVTDYLDRAGLTPHLEALGFYLVGYGCTTCIGNSGPLADEIARTIAENDLSVAAVLSGNRNFEGRIHPDVRMSYLASPPLVVAYALAGSVDVDLACDPLGEDLDGEPVYLRDIWPSARAIDETIRDALRPDMFSRRYASVFAGDERWEALRAPGGSRYPWSEGSTYVRRPAFLEGLPSDPAPLADVRGARVLALLGDDVTTDHISPAGVIRPDSPAGRWLLEHGVAPSEFNSYGARRGNHEVMVRGTFANVRLRNRLAPGTEGGLTVHLPDGTTMSIHEAAMRYREEGVPLLILAGEAYGSGSSRDWAAKGTAMLGVRAVIAQSFERIHRSNLLGMGVLPLELETGQSVQSLGLTGRERYDILGLEGAETGAFPRELRVRADDVELTVRVRIDTPAEAAYFRHGGILPYVLRQLAARAERSVAMRAPTSEARR